MRLEWLDFSKALNVRSGLALHSPLFDVFLVYVCVFIITVWVHSYDGINVDVIHAERTKQQRDNVVKQFRAGRVWVMIATDLMARGLVRPSSSFFLFPRTA